VDFAQQLRETEGSIEPEHRPGTLSVAHESYLAAQAVDPELARALGVRSLIERSDVAELPEPWDSWANFPAILFPWTGMDGRVEYQVRPDNPTESANGRPRKYVFRKGMIPVLWLVRPPGKGSSGRGGRMLIVEGTKQCLAAASYAPEEVAVYGIAGCRSWQSDGVPIPDLAQADSRDVVVILDADAAGNAEVYAAGMGLAGALATEGAASVKFARLPASGKAGLDDVLAGREPGRRAAYLARVVDAAKARPADTKPRAKKKDQDSPGSPDRVTLVCNRDRLEVINDLTAALIGKWDGRELFNHGGVISRLKDAAMVPIDRGASRDLIQETAVTVNENETAQGTTYDYTWPDANSIQATLSRAEKFSPLERVSRAPFVRPDGSVVTEPGYDEATRTMLVTDPEVTGIEVPEDPTESEVRAARELLLGEWLGDFPFDTDADRANALALIVTPAVRGLVPRVPLAIVDGLQMGVGKNLLADSILTVYTGEPARPMNFVDEKEELRKQITSAFRTGAEFFVFDEAHTIEGAALAQALTATTWQDRILGVSTMAEFPNKVTWISLGNQVQVRGDLTRRVYRIALRPTYADPQDRAASSFRHPGQSGLDLGSWTRANRRDLLRAVLTLVRAWFAAGQPYPARSISFGSFETWERIVGGIVATAGLEGFLGNLTVWRSESDFDSQYWSGHLGWLAEQFGQNPFRTAEVKSKAMADPAGYLAPPRLDDPSEKGYSKALGEAYARLRGRRYDGAHMERVGSVHGHVSLWRVVTDNRPKSDESSTGGDPGGPGGPPLPNTGEEHTFKGGVTGESTQSEPTAPTEPEQELVSGKHASEAPPESPRSPSQTHEVGSGQSAFDTQDHLTATGLVTFDLETGDAGDLYRHPEPATYVRLAGWSSDDDSVKITPYGAREAATVVRSGAVVTGHNVMAFDLPALVRAGHLEMSEIHAMAAQGRLFDGLLAARYLDPPMARDKGVDASRKYDLDTLGKKFELGGKVAKLGDLAKKYGGWDQIPTDDPEFREYLVGDVELSRALHHRLMSDLGGTVPPYLVREHRVAALAAQISLNGFRVWTGELESRVAEINQRKARSMEVLAGRYGIPTHDARGKAYLAPLGTKAGKAALATALTAAGATSYWTTEKTGEIAIGGEHMRHLASEYHHIPAVREIAKHVYRIVGARSVYQTAMDCLCPDGRVHPRVAFKQATGRWSLTEPGLTVFGKRGGRHVEREIFLPDPGELVLAVDLSQVDMRGVAGLSQDHAYIDMLTKEDPHSEIAKALFGDVGKREQAKAIGHGWNYGRGIKAISEGEEIDPGLVRQFDASMRERFPRVVEWQDEVRALAESGELLDNGFGRLMRPDPQRAHTQGPALMGQGAARDIMMEGLLRLADAAPEVLPMLRAQVHDEIVLSVPVDQVEDVRRTVVEAFTWEWRGVPILADASPAASNWGAVYEK
jgi:hypothetical protein